MRNTIVDQKIILLMLLTVFLICTVQSISHGGGAIGAIGEVAGCWDSCVLLGQLSVLLGQLSVLLGQLSVLLGQLSEQSEVLLLMLFKSLPVSLTSVFASLPLSSGIQIVSQV